ncbi:DUF2235 domain-containing protein [Aeromonas cavernicola]|uniref:Uncharacterized protein n=1 Tax=Aeromonas cavernicola TaxID=1006623 RepID=A0A2H9U1B4_9GAMM|nr:DUF2235 domain-containing protein [Aeromonas cavernicola]PJG57846.1 hypothetical protein CUC53_15770 [Aeromonas cavernicola]
MADREDLTCRVEREESLHQAGIGTCSLALQIGVFFDGSNRNIYIDEAHQRLTNVGRLFRAHPLEIKAPLTSSYSYAKIYVPGLGTELNDTTADRLDSIMDARQQALAGDYLDELAGQAKQTVADAIKGDWSKVLSHKLSDLLTLKSSGEASFAALKKAAQQAALEAVAPIRDMAPVADLLMTGVDARIDFAKNKFKENLALSKKENQLPIKLIQVSVFGADLGAALARRFIEELLESVCTKLDDEYRYEGSKVEVIFAGLFDCSRRGVLDMGDTVTTVFDWASLFTKSPAAMPIGVVASAKVIDHNKPLHPAVKRALHLVAAHERRGYRPLLPLGPLQPGWREELYPGVSEDVTGGLLPNEQRPSAELCRVPLRAMFDTARRAQVPFPNFRTLEKTSRKVASYFVMLDNLAGYSVQEFCHYYQQWAGRLDPTPDGFERHMTCYCLWLGEKHYDYSARRKLATDDERALLKERWGWLEQVWQDAKAIKQANELRLRIRNAAELVVNFNESSKRVPLMVNAFFNYFMHDFSSKELKYATLTAQAHTMLTSNNFFVPRRIETVEADESDEVKADK